MNKNEELLPYYVEASKRVSYNPLTGDMVWCKTNTNKIKIGDSVSNVSACGYLRMSLTVDGVFKTIFVHRLAWFIHYNELPNVIDHVDGDKLNNKISNLRSCTQQQNSLNSRKQKNNTSGFKGVSWNKISKKYATTIRVNGKSKFLGLFDCPKEASKVYEAKAKELFGEFYRSPKCK